MKKSRLAGRLLVLLLVSVASAHHIYRDEEQWHITGKAAFLQYQSSRFDRFMATVPATRLFGYVIFCILVLLTYEALAFGAGAVFTRFALAKDEEK